MDEELERARRAVREAPGDLGAALRLASLLERSGEVGQAWDLLLRSRGAVGEERWREVRAVAREIARRSPAELTAHLRKKSSAAVLNSSGLLMGDGAVELPLVALACDEHESVARLAAQRGLRATAAKAFDDPGGRMPLPEDLRASLGSIDPLPMHDDGDPFNPWRIVEKARKERLLALAPWLLAMFDAPATALATDAKLCFQELTGQRDVPLDVEKLAAHWERIKPQT